VCGGMKKQWDLFQPQPRRPMTQLPAHGSGFARIDPAGQVVVWSAADLTASDRGGLILHPKDTKRELDTWLQGACLAPICWQCTAARAWLEHSWRPRPVLLIEGTGQHPGGPFALLGSCSRHGAGWRLLPMGLAPAQPPRPWVRRRRPSCWWSKGPGPPPLSAEDLEGDSVWGHWATRT